MRSTDLICWNECDTYCLLNIDYITAYVLQLQPYLSWLMKLLLLQLGMFIRVLLTWAIVKNLITLTFKKVVLKPLAFLDLEAFMLTSEIGN